MGLDNRAFVYTDDFQRHRDERHSALKVFKPNYLGGTLKFDVDVSDLGCNCAAGVFLVAFDEGTCNWGNVVNNDNYHCTTVDVMVANNKGFETASHPYENGSRDITKQCKSDKLYGVAYGPGSEYFINTLEPYTVET